MALMDSNGHGKAKAICEQIDGATLDTNMPNKIIDEGNLVLDETGMLAIKTREGLKEISEIVTTLFNKKDELKSVVGREGNQLSLNYEAYLARTRLSEQKQSENNEQVVEPTGSSSSTINKPSTRKDISQKIWE